MEKFAKDIYRLDNGKNVCIEFYGHASLMIDYNNVKIYLDPVSEYADYTKLPKADIILITHDHYDHFDKEAINKIIKPTTEIVANFDTINTYGSGKIIKNYETIECLGVKIKAFPAYNTTQDREKFHPKGRDNGYLITIDNMHIYISGDTEIVDNNEEIKNCDILFLAINQPYTMTIQQAEHYAKQVNPKIFYPYHTTDTDINLLRKTFEQYNFKTIIHPMH